MSQAIEETKGHVEKKQSYTYEEMEAEREEVSICSSDEYFWEALGLLELTFSCFWT